MTTTTFTVSTVTEINGKIATAKVGDFATVSKAYAAAKKAAGKGAAFSAHYGPTSAAYVGSTVTAVIAH